MSGCNLEKFVVAPPCISSVAEMVVVEEGWGIGFEVGFNWVVWVSIAGLSQITGGW